MRVLVTGATGLIGSHLLGQLLDDHLVYATTRTVDRRLDPRAEWTQIDLTENEAVGELVNRIRPDAICHLAALVDGRRALDVVLPTLRANVLASVSLLEAASRVGCSRVVLAGSLVEVGGVHGEPLTPASPYDASRLASSAYGRMFHALFELPVVTLRPSYVYGPHQRDANKLVPHVVTSLLADVSPGLSTGGRTMDWLYAGDAAAAFRAALAAEGVEGHTLDVSSGDRRSVREVVELIHGIIAPPSADADFGNVPTRRYDFDLSSGDPTSTRALLGWAPAVSLQRGLELTIDWFRAGCPEASTS